MDAFTLAAKLSLDSSSFKSGLKGAETQAKGMTGFIEKAVNAAKALASALVIKKGIEAMKQLADAAAAAGDKIDKQSQALGMSRQAYQEWDYILSQNGSTIDSLGTSMKTLSSAIVDGSKSGINAFEKLGLSIDELRMQDMETQFENVVRAFQKMPEGAEKAALAVDLFGRNGMELLPLLNNTATSIDELRQKAMELGIIMEDDAVNASVRYTDAMDTLNRTFNAVKYAIGAEMLPALAEMAEKGAAYLGRLVNAFRDEGFEGAFKEAGKIIGELADSIGKAFDDTVKAITEIDWLQLGVDVFNWISGAFTGIAGWFSERFTAAKNAIASVNWAKAGADILEKIGSALADFANWFKEKFEAATDAIESIEWAEVGSSIWGFISGAFSDIASWFAETFGLGADAAENGVDWAGLGTAILDFIDAGLSAIGDYIYGYFSSAWETIQEIDWATVGTAIKDKIVETLGAIVENMTDFFNNAADAINEIDWEGVGTWIRETIEAAVEAISGWFNKLFGGIISDTEGLDWDGLGESIVALLEAGLKAIDGLLTGLFGDEWTQLKTDAEESWAAIQAAVEYATEGIQAAWEAISGFFTDTIPQVWEDLSGKATEIWENIESAVTEAIDNAKSTLEDLWGDIQSKAEEIWSGIEATAESVWSSIQSFIEDPIGTVKENLATLWDNISSKVTEVWNAIQSTITSVIQAITEPITSFIGTVQNAVDGVLKFLGLKPSDTPKWNDDVNKGITTPMSNASSAVASVLSEIADLEKKDGLTVNTTANTYKHTYNYEHFERDSETGSGSAGKFASAMSGGKILRGATVFGFNDNGPMIGGEAGPEAIVGVNSLDQMIANSVQKGLSGIAAGIAQALNGGNQQPIYVVLDTGALVGAIGGEMDAELARYGNWAAGGGA